METSSFDATGLNGLFNNPDLEIDFDTVMSVPSAKERIRAYSARYFEWIGEALARKVKGLAASASTAAKSVVERLHAACSKCNGAKFVLIRKLGQYVACARCAGKGYTTPVDDERHAAYLARTKRDVTYVNHLIPAV